MSADLVIKSSTQRILVDPPTRSATVVLAGPMGPTGPSGGVSEAEMDAAITAALEEFEGGGGGGTGEDGASAYEVAVANGFVGSEAAWLASLVGPPGADGEDGAPGIPGADGDDGADGASAYEIAVANGFVGTEVDWLLSLVGADGAPGADGEDGAPGADGADGGFILGQTHEFTDSDADTLVSIRIHDDGTSTATWPERRVNWFERAAGVFRRVSYDNEYGELRCIAAKSNTVPLRIYQKEQSGDSARDMSVPLTEWRDNRTTNTLLACINSDGSPQFSGGIVTNANTAITAALTDWGKKVRTTAATAVTFTVPPNATVAFPIGAEITVIQAGAGQVTFAQGAGVTINSTPGLKISAQRGAATLVKVATNEWDLFGNLAA